MQISISQAENLCSESIAFYINKSLYWTEDCNYAVNLSIGTIQLALFLYLF